MNSLANKLLRPTWAEISLGKLRRNYARVRRLAGERQLMAVIKADAYGHGAVAVANCLAACGADWFGVASVEEALELRAAGITQPILLLGGLYMSDPADLVNFQLTPSVSSTARLDTYVSCARRHGRPIEFHLKVDTGLGRLGVPPDRLEAFLEHYRTLEGIRLTGLFTHLASAEDLVATQTEEQGERFRAALAQVQAAGIDLAFTHVSNSSALLTRRHFPENMVRIGGLLYGLYLPSSSRRTLNLRLYPISSQCSPSNPASSTLRTSPAARPSATARLSTPGALPASPPSPSATRTASTARSPIAATPSCAADWRGWWAASAWTSPC